MPSRGASADAALVTVIVWVDLQSQVTQRLWPLVVHLLSAHGAEVRVVVAQHPQAHHSYAEFTAHALLAAHQQGKFWPLFEALLETPDALARHEVELAAARLGVDLVRLRRAVDGGELVAQVEAEQALALAAGLRSAPGLMVDGEALSGLLLTWEQLDGVVRGALAESRALVAAQGLGGEALRAARFRQRFVPVAPAREPVVALGAKRLHVPLDDSPTLGPADALVTAVLFTRFRCSYCQDATQRLRKLMTEDPSLLRLVFKHSPDAHPDTQRAHLAAAAAHRQGQFWPFYDWLMSAHPDAPLPAEALRAAAVKLGLDVARFDADIADLTLGDALRKDLDQAAAVHVRGAPHLLLNGVRFSGAQPLGAFRAAIAREVAIAQRQVEAGTPRSADALYALLTSPAPQPAPPAPPALGPADAPNTLTSFLDFGSPFCPDALAAVRAALTAPPAPTRWEFRHFPVDDDPRAWRMAKASAAAHRQGQFWRFLERLEAARCAASPDDLLAIAADLGLDRARFEADLSDPTLDALILADIRFAREMGLSGAPGFLINGELLRGAQPADALTERLTPPPTP